MAGSLLNDSVTVTADASGAATAQIGPSNAKGAPMWHVTRVALRNETLARRGQTPIPKADVYTDEPSPNTWIDGTYDGSFDGTDCDLTITRGQVVTAVWAGAQAGDRLTLSVSGEVIRDGVS
jgi:hypothetical protein